MFGDDEGKRAIAHRKGSGSGTGEHMSVNNARIEGPNESLDACGEDRANSPFNRRTYYLRLKAELLGCLSKGAVGGSRYGDGPSPLDKDASQVNHVALRATDLKCVAYQ